MMCKVLIFSCISAVMLMTAAYGAPLSTEKVHLLRALIKDLKSLEKSKDKIHLDLYTPNERQECSWRTLQCYLTEMGTLENEIEDEDIDNLQNIKKNLQSLMDLIPPGTGCKICEANDKKTFPAFHQELSNFLISMLK
ncbi:PREDICTED: interleukin-15-like [Aptenodytes forsteri]|uniref:interleukin-15-like n=1 Tax=Aptenodytes forsteri TaxID=9233 RepID=UPI0004F439C0|nr:PREDICTED: interleukin-15-like [Aptenodytes forsteri]